MFNAAQIYRRATKVKRLAEELQQHLENDAEHAEDGHARWLLDLANGINGAVVAAGRVADAALSSHGRGGET